MSEIEKIKLYQNAGIVPTYTDECIIADRYWENEELANEYGTFDKFMERNCKFGYQDCTDECEYAYTKTHYPPFTAEKQLAIIKLLAKWEITILHLLDTWYFSTDGIIGISKLKGDFEEALANYINSVWQNLTETEREEIRKILKG